MLHLLIFKKSIIQLSSAIYELLNGISIDNIPMRMLVCLIGGYYGTGAWDYMKNVFLLSIKVTSHIFGGRLESNLQLCVFILPVSILKEMIYTAIYWALQIAKNVSLYLAEYIKLLCLADISNQICRFFKIKYCFWRDMLVYSVLDSFSPKYSLFKYPYSWISNLIIFALQKEKCNPNVSVCLF